MQKTCHAAAVFCIFLYSSAVSTHAECKFLVQIFCTRNLHLVSMDYFLFSQVAEIEERIGNMAEKWDEAREAKCAIFPLCSNSIEKRLQTEENYEVSFHHEVDTWGDGDGR